MHHPVRALEDPTASVSCSPAERQSSWTRRSESRPWPYPWPAGELASPRGSSQASPLQRTRGFDGTLAPLDAVSRACVEPQPMQIEFAPERLVLRDKDAKAR